MIDEKGLDEIVKAAWRKARGPLVGASDGQTYVVPALANDLMRDICRTAITAYLSASAEPVGWVYEWKPIGINNTWQVHISLEDPRLDGVREYRKVQPLYTHPGAPNV